MAWKHLVMVTLLCELRMRWLVITSLLCILVYSNLLLIGRVQRGLNVLFGNFGGWDWVWLTTIYVLLVITKKRISFIFFEIVTMLVCSGNFLFEGMMAMNFIPLLIGRCGCKLISFYDPSSSWYKLVFAVWRVVIFYGAGVIGSFFMMIIEQLRRLFTKLVIGFVLIKKLLPFISLSVPLTWRLVHSKCDRHQMGFS